VGIENPVHLLFLGAVALIVLGPKRLPELARAAGKGMREFRESLNGEGGTEEPHAGGAVDQPVAAQAQVQAPVAQLTPGPPDGEPAAGGQGSPPPA
jgi:sec-independent protein translocase protein TatA